MTDWTWEYMTDASHVVGGMDPDLIEEAERIAQRLADATSVKYFGDPPIEESGVSKLINFSEGRWMIVYQEHRRYRAIYIVRVQHWPA